MDVSRIGTHPFRPQRKRIIPVLEKPQHKPVVYEVEDGCLKDAKGMPGHRHRVTTVEEKKGRLFQKRADTTVGHIRRKDKVYLPSTISADTQLKVLREITGKVGLHQVSLTLKLLELTGQLKPLLTAHDIKILETRKENKEQQSNHQEKYIMV